MKLRIAFSFLLLNCGCASIPYPVEIKDKSQFSQACVTEIEKLREIDLSKPSPLDGFIKNQLCIAQKACDSRSEFVDGVWLDNVLSEFIEAYLQKTNNWENVINKCEARNTIEPINGLLCQKDMAQYHIFTDLSYAVSKNGCGTEIDWTILENAIRQCVNEAKYPFFISQYVKNRVINYRNEVRKECIRKFQKQ